jgi:hypothetical protein
MIATEILEEALTLTEAVTVAERLGHPLDRNNLTRYATEGRLLARKSGGTWLTTRSALRDLIVSLESETRGRPRQVRIGKRVAQYTRTPALVERLGEIQRLRSQLRSHKLSASQEARLWKELTTSAIYHTNRMEGNALSFQEAAAIIEQYREHPATAVADTSNISSE